MTIYKFSPGEKDPDEKQEGMDVVVDLLTPVTPDDTKSSPLIGVTYGEAVRRRKLIFNAMVILAVLIFVASAIVGGVFLYQQFAHKGHYEPTYIDHYKNQFTPTSARLKSMTSRPLVYGVNYFDTVSEEIHNTPHGYLEEKIEVLSMNNYERIQVPRFDECDSALIVHDFIHNYTAIVDGERMRCFVMKLNRTLVVPPKDVIDLVRKLWTGHYTPKVRTLREKYIVFPHTVRDVKVFGKFVANECHSFSTYKLVKYSTFYKKLMHRMREHFYGYYALRENVIKIEVHT